MKPIIEHSWAISEADAIDLQQQLALLVDPTDQFTSIKTVAGVDVAYDKHSNKLVAAAVVLDAITLAVLDSATAEDVERFPYIPGLFSFRELPPIDLALQQLKITPDLIVCDGQGLAHPRRFGLACHLGVLFDVPTIGCGKTRLVGEAQEPGCNRGDFFPLIDRGKTVGQLLRTQTGTKPVYVSVGHKVSLSTACEWVLKLSTKYRLPETTRLADQAVRNALKGLMASAQPTIP
jgi:deoxyribonuclease V